MHHLLDMNKSGSQNIFSTFSQPENASVSPSRHFYRLQGQIPACFHKLQLVKLLPLYQKPEKGTPFWQSPLYSPLWLVPPPPPPLYLVCWDKWAPKISPLLQIFEKGSRAMITLGEIFTLKDSSTWYLLTCTKKFCSQLFFPLTICVTPSFARGCKICISRDIDTLNRLIFFHRISPEDQTVLTWFQHYSHE